MRHASAKTLKRIAPVLRQLRKSDLKENGLGKFYKSSQAFLHFHEDESGIYADVKRKGKWQRMKVPQNKMEWKGFCRRCLQ